MLSANSEASINVECLVEDADLNYLMPREEFEKLMEPMLKKVETALK